MGVLILFNLPKLLASMLSCGGVQQASFAFCTKKYLVYFCSDKTKRGGGLVERVGFFILKCLLCLLVIEMMKFVNI